ncbi:MAG: hypothetical protein M1129_01305 [Candidatus Thermoplasmatota archaeon]|nr:hypothetical protein [Candidatus Thermoplasmatota archaeon]MCL5955693.1 hypothetical protein [Candidatus Thermoplasmatota archaeon]
MSVIIRQSLSLHHIITLKILEYYFLVLGKEFEDTTPIDPGKDVPP